MTEMENKIKRYKELVEEANNAYRDYLCGVSALAEQETDEALKEKIRYSYVKKDDFVICYLLEHGLTFEQTAYWVCGNDDQDYWTCTNCGFPVMAADDWSDPYEAEVKYCEKCGCRMIKPKR